MRKSTFKVGDKVNLTYQPTIDGVIVSELDVNNKFNKQKKEWNVHFVDNNVIGDRRFCSSDELIKAKPKLAIPKEEVLITKDAEND
jgi:hypothetical protein